MAASVLFGPQSLCCTDLWQLGNNNKIFWSAVIKHNQLNLSSTWRMLFRNKPVCPLLSCVTRKRPSGRGLWTRTTSPWTRVSSESVCARWVLVTLCLRTKKKQQCTIKWLPNNFISFFTCWIPDVQMWRVNFLFIFWVAFYCYFYIWMLTEKTRYTTNRKVNQNKIVLHLKWYNLDRLHD